MCPGTLRTDANGERYIDAGHVDANDGSTTALGQLGTRDSDAASRVGVLAKVWGQVDSTGSNYVNLRDGSLDSDGSYALLRVSTVGITKSMSAGTFQSLTGIVQKTTGGAAIVQPRAIPT